MLHSTASFSIYTDDENQEQVPGLEEFEKAVTIEVNKQESQVRGNDFSFDKQDMELIQEEEIEEDDGFSDADFDLRPPSPPLYLAAGLGIDASALGGVYDPVHHPSIHSSLILRNCVQSLWSEGKLQEAEEQCYEATLTYPEDGETLVLYAQFVWEVHHDREKASSYFERAALVAPNDSNILAARAKFLWELDNDEEDEIMIHVEEDRNIVVSSSSNERIEPVADTGESDMLEYYEKMLNENPTDPLLLKSYARFLHQSKTKLQGAEECYYRAIQADPSDGELLSEYANLVWELHHDYDKTSNYFEKATEASPNNSYVLGAYARFLWETDEYHGRDDQANKNDSQWSSNTEAVSVGNA